MTSALPSSARVGPGLAAGVSEEMIHQVVHTFYGHVRVDPALGPIFNRVIGGDWDRHLDKMCDFWSSVLLMTGRFRGAPLSVHAEIPDIRPTHFARWLHLFRQTVEAVCSSAAADLFIAKSEMIAQALQRHIHATRGETPGCASRRTGGRQGTRRAPSRTEPGFLASLPAGVRPYRRTDTFTEATVPAGLLRDHTTKSRTWGLIHVVEGRLAYRITDPRRAASEVVLTDETPPGVVEPTILHRVKPLGPVQFFVEFCRLDGAP